MTFTQSNWEEITDKISSTFRFDVEEKNRLEKNDVAKLIAAIPYNAGCENMERIALAHLGTYLIASDDSCRTDFGHKSADDSDMFTRMQQMNYYEGGEEEIIERGRNLLALIQLEDHYHDLEDDVANGKYNPIAAGSWDYEEMRAELVSRILSVASPEMDDVMTIDEVRGYWNNL